MYAYIHGSFCVEKLGFLGKEKDCKTSLRSQKSKTIKPRLAPLKKYNSSAPYTNL